MIQPLYGSRYAPRIWQYYYSEFLEKHGYNRGLASAALYRNEGCDASTCVHGDDFMLLGDDGAADGMDKAPRSR